MSQAKLYSIKLETKVGDIKIEGVEEYVFAKKYMYYSTIDDDVGRIVRSNIFKAFRQLRGSTKWVEIKPRQFTNKK